MPFHVVRKYNSNRYAVNGHTVYIRAKTLTSRWKRGFEAAISALTESDGKCPGEKMGASVFHGARLLSTGFNLYSKTKPGNSHRLDSGFVFDSSIHAEQMAIDRIKHYDYNNKKLTLYIARVDGNGKMACSRPCSVCVDYMKEHGIKVARFINEHGAPEEMVIA